MLISIFRKSLFLLLLFFSACTSHTDLKEFDWLLGQWVSNDSLGVEFMEDWKQSSPTSFTALSTALDVTGDTLFKETLKLQLIDGVPYYVATVPKNPGPVLFRLVEKKERLLIFENRDHDFPQQIRYSFDEKEMLHLRLDGREKGRPKSERLSFKRVSSSIPSPTN